MSDLVERLRATDCTDAAAARAMMMEAADFIVTARELLEVCRGCDLWSDAWPAYGVGSEIFGLKIDERTAVAEVVDSFLAA